MRWDSSSIVATAKRFNYYDDRCSHLLPSGSGLIHLLHLPFLESDEIEDEMPLLE